MLFASIACAEAAEMDLDEVISQVFLQDESVKIAAYDKAVAYEGVRQAERARGVTFAITHKSGIVDDQVNGKSVNSYTNNLVASYPLYTGGRLEGSIVKSVKLFESKDFDLESASRDLKLSAVRAFYEVLRCEDSKGIAEESLAQMTVHAKNAALFFENGRVGKSDLLNSEIELSSSRMDIIDAENALSAARKKLNVLMGLPLDAQITLKNPSLHYKTLSGSLEEYVALAMEKHPKLAAANLLVDAARADITVARSSGRPTATFAVEEDLASKNWPGADKNSLTVGVEIDFTIHDAGVTRSKIIAAEQSLVSAELTRDSLADSILLSVNENYENLKASEKKLAENEKAVGIADEAFKIAVIRYNAGAGTNTDVIDAANALSGAKSNYTQAVCDRNLYTALLENAIGADL
jgi:outer membrane protein TolC